MKDLIRLVVELTLLLGMSLIVALNEMALGYPTFR